MILLVPDPKLLDGLPAISMKEIYFLIMHLINSPTHENHPLLFSFQTSSIQKKYEESANLENILKTGILKAKKEEFSKCLKNKAVKVTSDKYAQLMLRNSELMDQIKEEREAMEYLKNISDSTHYTKHKATHKFMLIKYSPSLEIMKYEKYELNLFVK